MSDDRNQVEENSARIGDIEELLSPFFELQSENERLKVQIVSLNDHIAQLQADTNKPF